MLDDRTLFADWILEAVGKRATAIATVQEMVEWFAQHYEDPAESTPYCSEEGGYMYLCGGLTTLARRSRPTSPASTGLSAQTNGTRSPPPLPLKSKRTASTYGRRSLTTLSPSPTTIQSPNPMTIQSLTTRIQSLTTTLFVCSALITIITASVTCINFE
jgi:hypothetical protein